MVAAALLADPVASLVGQRVPRVRHVAHVGPGLDRRQLGHLDVGVHVGQDHLELALCDLHVAAEVRRTGLPLYRVRNLGDLTTDRCIDRRAIPGRVVAPLVARVAPECACDRLLGGEGFAHDELAGSGCSAAALAVVRGPRRVFLAPLGAALRLRIHAVCAVIQRVRIHADGPAAVEPVAGWTGVGARPSLAAVGGSRRVGLAALGASLVRREVAVHAVVERAGVQPDRAAAVQPTSVRTAGRPAIRAARDHVKDVPRRLRTRVFGLRRAGAARGARLARDVAREPPFDVQQGGALPAELVDAQVLDERR